MAAFYFLSFLAALIICLWISKCLVNKIDSKVFWESTDYYWYGLAIFAALTFFWDYRTSTFQLHTADAEENTVRIYFSIEQSLERFLGDECRGHAVEACGPTQEFKNTLTRHIVSPRFPGGELEYDGRLFRNPAAVWNVVFNEVTQAPNNYHFLYASLQIQTLTDVLGEFRSASRRQQQLLPPLIYAILGVLVALGITLKFGKVRHKVRELKRK